jgi:hypothetical protein
MDYRRQGKPTRSDGSHLWRRPAWHGWILPALVIAASATLLVIIVVEPTWAKVSGSAVLLGELVLLGLELVDKGLSARRGGRKPDPPEHQGLPSGDRDLHR